MSQKTINLTNCYTTKNLIKSTFEQSDSGEEAIQIVKNAIDDISARVSSIETDTTVDSHTHGDLKMDGTVGDGSQKNLNVVTNSDGRISTATFRPIPTQTSQLENNSGFLTSHQDITGKLNKNLGNDKKNLNVVTDDKGEITTEAKYTYTHPQYSVADFGPKITSSPNNPPTQNLTFGGDFYVPQIKRNNTGHISTDSYNVKVTMPSLPSISIADINDFPSTMPPSVHQHTQSDITDWSDWKLVGRYPKEGEGDVAENGAWQRIYSNDLLVYAFICTRSLPANNGTWSIAGELQINNSFYNPPTKLFCSYVNNSLIMLRSDKVIKVACYGATQTITANFYGTFLYPCGLGILNLPIGE